MKVSVKDLILIPLFTALTAVGAFIQVPMPLVSFTLQTFFVALSGVLLGSKKGLLSQLLYVLLGLAGAPIFTKGSGIGYVFQPTFGYLIGFIIGAFVIGLLVERLKKINLINIYLCILVGLAIIYVVGVPYLYMISNFYAGKAMTFGIAISYGFVPFIGGDLLSLIIAALVSARVLPILKRLGYGVKGRERAVRETP